jgi:hypothetical protein
VRTKKKTDRKRIRELKARLTNRTKFIMQEQRQTEERIGQKEA